MNMLDGDAKKVLFFKKKMNNPIFCLRVYVFLIYYYKVQIVYLYIEDSNVPIGKHLPETFRPVHIHVPQSNCEGVEKTLFLNSCWL